MKPPFWEKLLNDTRSNGKCLAVSLLVTLGTGLVASVASGDIRGSYESMKKPPLSPPGWVFPVVWTVLYILMAVAFCRMLTSGTAGTDGKGLSSEKKAAVRLYELQLLLNLSWPIVFFNMGLCWLSFVILLLLWFAVLGMIREFLALDRLSGWLLVPYLAWLTFAGYLNLGSCFLN